MNKQVLRVAVPQDVRSILAVWADEFAAPPVTNDRAEMTRLSRSLAEQEGLALISASTLSELAMYARARKCYGVRPGVRDEADKVCDWLEPLMPA